MKKLNILFFALIVIIFLIGNVENVYPADDTNELTGDAIQGNFLDKVFNFFKGLFGKKTVGTIVSGCSKYTSKLACEQNNCEWSSTMCLNPSEYVTSTLRITSTTLPTTTITIPVTTSITTSLSLPTTTTTLLTTTTTITVVQSNVFQSLTHNPVSPKSTDRITFTATTSGTATVSEIKIYVDDSTVKTCSISPCSSSLIGPFGAGAHTYKAVARDSSGNVYNSEVKSFTVTVSSPTTTSTTTLPTTTTTAASGCGQYTDDESCILDGVNCGWNSNRNPPCYTSDVGSGTAQTTTTITVVQSNVFQSLTHNPVSPKSTDRITFTATTSGTATVSEIKIYVDDSTVKTCSISPCSSSLIGPFGAGAHTYKAVARDSSGNVYNSEVKSFTVTVPPPTTTSTTTLPTTTTTAASGCGQYTDDESCILDGVNCGWNSNRNPPCYTSDVGSGTAQTTTTITVVQSNVFQSLTHNPVSPKSTDRITFTATTSGTATVSEIKIYVDDSTVKTCSISPCSSSLIGPFGAGAHTYKAVARDPSGNVYNSEVKSFTVTVLSPTTTVVSGCEQFTDPSDDEACLEYLSPPQRCDWDSNRNPPCFTLGTGFGTGNAIVSNIKLTGWAISNDGFFTKIKNFFLKLFGKKNVGIYTGPEINYIIERREYADNNWVNVDEVSNSDVCTDSICSFTDNTIVFNEGDTYFYRIKATRETEIGPYSNELSVDIPYDVQNENRNPMITSIPKTVAILNQEYQYDVDAADLDMDTLSYSLINIATGMNIDSSTCLIRWIPTQKGVYPVNIKVSDNKGGISYSDFELLVAGTGNLPSTGVNVRFEYLPDVDLTSDSSVNGLNNAHTLHIIADKDNAIKLISSRDR